MSLTTLKNRIEAGFSSQGITSYGYIWAESELSKLANQSLPYYGVILQTANIPDVLNPMAQNYIRYEVVLLAADNLHQADQVVTAANRWDYWFTKLGTLESQTFGILEGMIEYPTAQVNGSLSMRHIPYSTELNLVAVYTTFTIDIATNLCLHE